MKLFYFDTETTGTDPKRNAIVQLAYIVEIDGKVIREGNMLIKPFEGAKIEPEALKVNKRTEEEITQEPFKDFFASYKYFVRMLDTHIDRYNREDKFIMVGHNVHFDANFLSEFFKKNGDKYYGSYFGTQICTRVLLSYMGYKGLIKLHNYKLVTACQHYDIELDAHDAMNDIRATRELFLKLQEEG